MFLNSSEITNISTPKPFTCFKLPFMIKNSKLPQKPHYNLVVVAHIYVI